MSQIQCVGNSDSAGDSGLAGQPEAWVLDNEGCQGIGSEGETRPVEEETGEDTDCPSQRFSAEGVAGLWLGGAIKPLGIKTL